MVTLPFSENKDTCLEEAIRGALQQRGFGQRLHVVTRDGYVHLLGLVDALEEKKKIGAIVEGVPGVRMVTNHLHLRFVGDTKEVTHF